MIAALLLAAFLHIPPPPPPPGRSADRPLLSWSAGPISCDDGAVTALALEQPTGALLWSDGETRAPVTLRFTIDPSGRPVSIHHAKPESGPPSTDFAPALAASRFPAGAPQRGCAVTYTPTILPVTEAPVADLIAYTLAPDNGPMPQAGWDRIRLPGTCLDSPRPAPLLRALPDFSRIPATPGARDWAMVRYDTGAGGRPRRARVSFSTGNVALGAAAVKAIVDSRFTGGARTGCQYPFRLRAGLLVAPEMPAAMRAANDGPNCPHRPGFTTPPRLIFPEAYRRRMIEGWAVVRYDVASWGEIGNLSVVAAEPSDDFGAQAMTVMRSAALPVSERGLIGCVDRVRFVMGPDDMPSQDGAPKPIY